MILHSLVLILVPHSSIWLNNKTNAELERWIDLLLSLIGRVNSIKMSIISMCPLKSSNEFFKDLDKAVSLCLWWKKVPRVKLLTLQAPMWQRCELGLDRTTRSKIHVSKYYLLPCFKKQLCTSTSNPFILASYNAWIQLHAFLNFTYDCWLTHLLKVILTFPNLQQVVYYKLGSEKALEQSLFLYQ